MQKSLKNAPYKITPEGSLGVLALGARGVLAWREAVKQAQKLGNEKA